MALDDFDRELKELSPALGHTDKYDLRFKQ